MNVVEACGTGICSSEMPAASSEPGANGADGRIASNGAAPPRGAGDPFEAIEAAVVDGGFDEILVSTLPGQSSGRLRHELPARVERLGPPVTVVTAGESVPDLGGSRR